MTIKELIVELLEHGSDNEVKFIISDLPNDIEYKSDQPFFYWDYGTLNIIINPFQSYQDGPLSKDPDKHETTNNSFGNYLYKNIKKKSRKFKEAMSFSLYDDEYKKNKENGN